jgi:hypothetical protein
MYVVALVSTYDLMGGWWDRPAGHSVRMYTFQTWIINKLWWSALCYYNNQKTVHRQYGYLHTFACGGYQTPAHWAQWICTGRLSQHTPQHYSLIHCDHSISVVHNEINPHRLAFGPMHSQFRDIVTNRILLQSTRKPHCVHNSIIYLNQYPPLMT